MGHHAYLQFVEKKTVEGDIIAPLYDGAIEISSFGFDVSNRKDALKKSEELEAIQAAEVSGVSISKKVDASTPKILAHACVDKGLGDCKIFFLRPKQDLGSTTGLATFLEFKLENSNVENYNISGGSSYPTENITLKFSKIHWNLNDKKGGSVGKGSHSIPDTDTKGTAG